MQKVWDTGTDLKLRVRADVFNVTNARNWTTFSNFPGTAAGGPDPGFGNHNDDIMLPTRTFKLSFGLDW